ncbi:MAG: sugar phosphate isomerase/epimerase family protein, partial [Thermomicrobiales bacterium]
MSSQPLKIGLGFTLPGDTAPFERTASWMQERGFSGVMLGPDPAWSDEETARVGETFAAHGLAVFEVATYTSLIHADAAIRRRNIDAVKRKVEQAVILGSSCVATTSGTPLDLGPHPKTRTPECWDSLLEATAEILDAAPAGIRFSMEAWPPTVLYDIPTFHRFYAEAKDSRLGMVFDPANLVTIDNYFQTGAMIGATFEALGDRFAVAHCKDIEWVSGYSQTALKEVVPGRGSLDYAT